MRAPGAVDFVRPDPFPGWMSYKRRLNQVKFGFVGFRFGGFLYLSWLL